MRCRTHSATHFHDIACEVNGSFAGVIAGVTGEIF